jgi:hypothetical protein
MFDKDEPTSMTEEKIRSLESIGFKWARLTGEELWNQRYSDLVAFKNEVRYDIAAVPFHSFDVLIFLFAHVLVSQNGHCLVPTKSTDHPELSRLGRWVTTQRSKNTKKGEGLETEKKRKLNEIGFIW